MPLATQAMGNSCHWQLTLWQVMPSLATHDIGNSWLWQFMPWHLMPLATHAKKWQE